jgi:hypothetical protein
MSNLARLAKGAAPMVMTEAMAWSADYRPG